MKPQTCEWLKAANNDLIVIAEIIDNDLVTPAVAFHAQQCIEKCLKAVIEEFAPGVMKIHHLTVLYATAKAYLDLDFDHKIPLLETLDKLYIDSRYPGEFGLLPNGKPTLEDAREFYQFARHIYTIVCDRLKSVEEEPPSQAPDESDTA